jgi:hypothetical protein
MPRWGVSTKNGATRRVDVSQVASYLSERGEPHMSYRSIAKIASTMSIVSLMLLSACTQESQNELGRSIQNWTGTDGVLDIYAGDKLVRRFIKIDKLSTALGTTDNSPRPYRYGYGYVDLNLNYQVDSGEKKVYFEVSDYSTNYIFYENFNG